MKDIKIILVGWAILTTFLHLQHLSRPLPPNFGLSQPWHFAGVDQLQRAKYEGAVV
jgi:hypothetical protein